MDMKPLYNKEELSRITDDELVELLDKVVELNDDKLNGVLFLNKPFSEGTLAAVFFSKMYCMANSNHGPILSEELFSKLSKESQIIELEGIIDTMIGYLKTMEDLNKGFSQTIYKFAERLRDLDEVEFNRFMKTKNARRRDLDAKRKGI